MTESASQLIVQVRQQGLQPNGHLRRLFSASREVFQGTEGRATVSGGAAGPLARCGHNGVGLRSGRPMRSPTALVQRMRTGRQDVEGLAVLWRCGSRPSGHPAP